jgi:hypothetical protein
MLKNILGKGALVAVSLGTLLITTFACDQAAPKCAAGRGAFATKYRPVGGPPECADLKGEKLGFGTYNPMGNAGRPNLDSASIAIQSESLGLLVDNADQAGIKDLDPNHKPYAFGTFTTSEPAGDFCTVPSFSVATQALPAVAADETKKISEQPATTVSYEWRNVRLYVTSLAYGTQFTGELTKTTDGVVCQYSVLGMYPYVDCAAADPADPNKTIPDDKLCESEPNYAEGRPTGSGVNPDFPVRCDPELKVCMLTKDTVPALR